MTERSDNVACSTTGCDRPAVQTVDIRNSRGRGAPLDYCEHHAFEAALRINQRPGMTALIEPVYFGGSDAR